MATARDHVRCILLPLALAALGSGAETAPAPAPAPGQATQPAPAALLSDAEVQAKVDAISKQMEQISSEPFTHGFGKEAAGLLVALNDTVAHAADRTAAATMHARLETALLLMLGCDNAGAHALMPGLVADARTADAKKDVLQLEFELAQGEGDLAQMQALADQAQKAGLDAETLDGFKQALEDERALPDGKPFTPFSLTDTAGKVHALADYAGKVLLIDFWATWCGPCMEEMPHVQALYGAYHAQGLEILGVSLDQERDKLDAVVASRKIAWPMVFDGQGWESAFPKACRISSIPHVFLIGKDGTLLGKEFRGDQLEDAIKRLLAASGSAASAPPEGKPAAAAPFALAPVDPTPAPAPAGH